MIDVGMSTGPMVTLMNDLIDREDDFINSILIVKNGSLVFEEYFSGGYQLDLFDGDLNYLEGVEFTRNTLQYQGSVSKSITSALAGIAIDQGLITSIDNKLFSYFPDYQELNTGEKDDITIRHLLTLTSGFPWYDDDIDANNSDEVLMFTHEDPIRFLLEKPVLATPGTDWEYNSGCNVLLGEIISRASGMDLHEFAKQELFEPLGITNSEWAHCINDESIVIASGGLYLRPRDMAKFGQLFLQNGQWNGEFLFSDTWVNESTTSYSNIVNQTYHYQQTGYGYNWWIGQFDGGIETYVAMGFGGQFIFVIPDEDMIIVVAGGNYDANSPFDPEPFTIFDYIVNGHILQCLP